MRFESAVKTMGSGTSLPRGEGDVDIRFVKGRYRYRFHLKPWQYKIVDAALEIVRLETGYQREAALDAIATAYVAQGGSEATMEIVPDGGVAERRLFRLFPDQHHIVRGALDMARQFVPTDTDALVQMCLWFVKTRR